MRNTIYALELQDGKWYIGKTTKELTTRFNEHKNGYGSQWTTKYPPIKIIKIMDGDGIDEHNMTIRYMKDKGIENVRGASYTGIVLKHYQQTDLEDIILGAKDKCYNCGESGHFINNCKKPKNIYECYNCGVLGHLGRNCPENRKRKQSEDTSQDIELKIPKQA